MQLLYHCSQKEINYIIIMVISYLARYLLVLLVRMEDVVFHMKGHKVTMTCAHIILAVPCFMKVLNFGHAVKKELQTLIPFLVNLVVQLALINGSKRYVFPLIKYSFINIFIEVKGNVIIIY